jgi:hypothetical protein
MMRGLAELLLLCNSRMERAELRDSASYAAASGPH